MKIWVAAYNTHPNDGEANLYYCETRSAAEKYLCQLLAGNIPDCDPDDSDQRKFARAFFARIDEGDYGSALERYQTAIQEFEWSETFSVYETRLLTEADSTLMADVAKIRAAWPGPAHAGIETGLDDGEE